MTWVSARSLEPCDMPKCYDVTGLQLRTYHRAHVIFHVDFASGR